MQGRSGKQKANLLVILILLMGVVGFFVCINIFPDTPQLEFAEKYSQSEEIVTPTNTIQEEELSIVEQLPFTAEVINVDGLTLNDVSALPIKNISASSTLINSRGVVFGTDNLKDGDIQTSWQEGEKGFGYETIIDVELSELSDIKYFVIYNGNQLSEKKFYQNNRLKDVRIEVDGEIVELTLPDTMEPIVIMMNNLGYTDHVVMEILSVYRGSKYNDTCISEIMCLQENYY